MKGDFNDVVAFGNHIKHNNINYHEAKHDKLF